MNAKKNFLTGAVTGVAGLCLKSGLNILVFPTILKGLGLQHFGLYVLLLNMVELIILMDFGFSNGLIQRLSSYQAKSQSNDVREMLSAGIFLYAVLSIGSLLALTLLAPSITPFFGLSDPHLIEVMTFCLYFVFLEGALTLFQGYFSAVLISHSLYHYVNTSETVYFLVANGGIFFLIQAGLGLPEISMLRFVASVVKFALIFSHAVRIEPDILQPVRCGLSRVIELLKLSLHAMVKHISDMLSTRFDLILIGRILGLREVGIFEFTYRFLNVLAQFPVQIANGLFPLFTKWSTLNCYRQNRLFFIRLSTLLGFFISVAIGELLIFYQPLFHLFAGKEIAIEETLPILLLAIPTIISGALHLPALHYLFAIGQYRHVTASGLTSALLKLVLCLVLMHWWGLIGVVVATLITGIIQHQVLMIGKALEHLKLSLKQYIFHVYGKNMLPVAICLGATFIVRQFFSMFFPEVVSVVISLLLSLSFGSFFWYSTTATRMEKRLLKNLLVKWSNSLPWLDRRIPTGESV